MTKKVCTKCHKNLSLDNFYPSYSKKPGSRASCKQCEHKRAKQYRQTKINSQQCSLCTNIVTSGKRVCAVCLSRNVLKTKNHRRQQKIKAVLYKGSCCSICNNIYQPPAFEFHHKQNKNRDIASLLSGSWDNIEAELQDCDLVCLNCHRELHYAERAGHVGKRSNTRRNRKIKAAATLGNICYKCGKYFNTIEVFDFHHLDPTTKFSSIGNLLARRGWGIVEQELSKCILLCGNCHRVLHWKIEQQNEIEMDLCTIYSIEELLLSKTKKKEV
jgi:hypothetical protein